MPNAALRLLRSVSLYSLAMMGPRLLRLVTIPLVVHAVSIDVYGVFVILMTIVPFAQIAADGGTGTAALRLAPEEDDRGRASLYASLLGSRLATGLAVTAILVLAEEPLRRWLQSGVEGPSLMPLVIANVLPAALLGALGDQLRSEERHGTLSALTLAQASAEAGLTVGLVVVRHDGLRGLVLAVLYARLLLLVPFLYACRATFRGRPSLARTGRLFRLGAPIGVLYALSSVREFDRYLVKLRLGVGDVARYDLAMRIISPIVLANMALTLALQPHVYRTFAEREGEERLALFFGGYVVTFGTVAFGVSALAPEIFPILAPGSYQGAAVIAPALVFSFVADGVMRIVGLGADFAKRTGPWAVVALVHSCVALPLSWVLLPRVGLIGAAIGLFLATVTSTVVCRLLVQRVYPLALPVARALAVIALGCAGCTALVAFSARGVASLALRALVTAFFAVVAFRVIGLDRSRLGAALRSEPSR